MDKSERTETTYLKKVLIDGYCCERDPFGWTLNSLDCEAVTIEHMGLRQLMRMPTATRLNRRNKERFGLAVSRHFHYLYQANQLVALASRALLTWHWFLTFSCNSWQDSEPAYFPRCKNITNSSASYSKQWGPTCFNIHTLNVEASWLCNRFHTVVVFCLCSSHWVEVAV